MPGVNEDEGNNNNIQTASFDVVEFITCARYGELPEMISLVSSHLLSHPNTSLSQLFAVTLPPSNSTALHMAAANGHLPILQYLLPHLTPTIINLQNAEGNTALHWSAINGKKEVVELLLKAGAQTDIRNIAGKTALYEAQNRGMEEVVEALLNYYVENS